MFLYTLCRQPCVRSPTPGHALTELTLAAFSQGGCVRLPLEAAPLRWRGREYLPSMAPGEATSVHRRQPRVRFGASKG